MEREDTQPRRTARKWTRRLAWLLGIPAAIVVAGWVTIFDPFSVPPELARGLPSEFRAADRIFKERLAQAFALPISERALVAELRQQGFDVAPEHAQASFSTQKLVCRLHWRIGWEAEQGDVASVSAHYGGVCL